MKKKILFVFTAALLINFKVHGDQEKCKMLNSTQGQSLPENDILLEVLESAEVCPSNVTSLSRLLEMKGYSSHPSMVANRGRNNPQKGSFSFFEVVTSDAYVFDDAPSAILYFGHFIHKQQNIISLDQDPTQGKLLIELIAWDVDKKLYNFYELIGNGKGGNWIYRGDSSDILKDNSKLHLMASDEPQQFGKTLRCSACHNSGGPIMKEMTWPHNDWWTNQRALDFGDSRVSRQISQRVEKILSADKFSDFVKDGIYQLEKSPKYQALKSGFSLKEKLRPLFCEIEINLESSESAELWSDSYGEPFSIPSAGIIHPLLYLGPLKVDKYEYLQLLEKNQMQFPETSHQDADHAWLTPVKGYSDLQAIQSLLLNQVIDQEFVSDVAALDLRNPVLSRKRCDLLKLIPEIENWKRDFVNILKYSSKDGAFELYENLTDPVKNIFYHIQTARLQFLQVQWQLDSETQVGEVFDDLIQLREGVYSSPISKNPLGQILEPGFRVIFPVVKTR